MQSLAKENDGYKYLLNVIDLFSKTAYSIPLKSKSSEVIIDAFETLFTNRRPKKLWTDQGSEFISTVIRLENFSMIITLNFTTYSTKVKPWSLKDLIEHSEK